MPWYWCSFPMWSPFEGIGSKQHDGASRCNLWPVALLNRPLVHNPCAISQYLRSALSVATSSSVHAVGGRCLSQPRLCLFPFASSDAFTTFTLNFAHGQQLEPEAMRDASLEGPQQ